MGGIHLCEGSMNAKQYIRILQSRVIPQADDWYKVAEWIFQHDLAPCHTAKSVKKFLNDSNIQVLPWPANSPDLNPIENIFHNVKNKLKEDAITRNITHESYENFCKRVKDTLENFSTQVIATPILVPEEDERGKCNV